MVMKSSLESGESKARHSHVSHETPTRQHTSYINTRLVSVPRAPRPQIQERSVGKSKTEQVKMRGVFFHLTKATKNRRPFFQSHGPFERHSLLKQHHSRPYFRSPLLSKNHTSSSSTAAAAVDGSRNGFVNWYLGMLEARPVLTKSITAGVIFTAADISSQV